MKEKIILLSLKEIYFNQMVEGKKKYEYRSRFLKEKSTAYIYISKTKKQIVAKIEFGKPIIGSKEEIAKLSLNDHPDLYESMLEYFKKGIGYAIPILKITMLENPKTLKQLKEKFNDFVAPQSYYILNNKKELLAYINSK